VVFLYNASFDGGVVFAKPETVTSVSCRDFVRLIGMLVRIERA